MQGSSVTDIIMTSITMEMPCVFLRAPAQVRKPAFSGVLDDFRSRAAAAAERLAKIKSCLTGGKRKTHTLKNSICHSEATRSMSGVCDRAALTKPCGNTRGAADRREERGSGTDGQSVAATERGSETV